MHHNKFHQRRNHQHNPNTKTDILIRAAGLENHIQAMFDQGFDNKKQCYKALIINENNVQKAIDFLKNKNQMQNQFEHEKGFVKQLDQQYQEQLKQLELMGYNKKNQNSKAIIKSGGNIDKAIEFLEKKKNEKKQIKKLFPQFEQQVIQIINQGFNNPNKIIQALKVCDGDQNQAIQLLTLQRQEKLERKKKEQAQMDDIFTQKLLNLKEKGFDEKQAQKSLIRSKGDEQKALDVLIDRNQMQFDDSTQQQYNSELEYFAQQGFCNPKKIIKTLQACNNNREKALLVLNQQKQQDHSSNNDKLKTHIKKEITADIVKLVIDGNSLLYAESKTRQMCQKQKKKQAEAALAQVLKQFVQIKKIQQICLVFDQTDNVYVQQLQFQVINQEKQQEEQKFNQQQICTFTQISAQPQFKNNEDYIFDLCLQEKLLKSQIIIVSSDEQLQMHLIEKGGLSIMKVKRLIKMMKDTLGLQNYIKLIEEK